jgi:predicted nucleic acid-binding protein
MPCLVDTDILVDFTRGNRMASDFLDGLDSDWSISAVTSLEMMAGARNQREISEIEILLSSVPAILPGAAIARRAYHLIKTYAKSDGLRTLDSLIAATALEEGMALATRNRKHFRMIDGLRLAAPTY